MSLSEELAQMHASGDIGQALAGIPERVARLEQERDALRAACEEFVRKCEAGQARSIRSYALDALRDTAERYWYAYACACELGPERERAFSIYEDLRRARCKAKV